MLPQVGLGLGGVTICGSLPALLDACLLLTLSPPHVDLPSILVLLSLDIRRPGKEPEKIVTCIK